MGFVQWVSFLSELVSVPDVQISTKSDCQSACISLGICSFPVVSVYGCYGLNKFTSNFVFFCYSDCSYCFYSF